MRLTLKNKEWTCQLTTPMYDKLHDLEDIEEELGINLVTLFKALKQGYIIDVFFNEKVKSLSDDQNLLIDLDNKCFYDCFIMNTGKYNKVYYFEDYGKTWALTKEELL